MTTPGRVDGIFQKIDPWITDDPDIATAGPLAELLYIRGLLYIRRNLRNGDIPKRCLGEISDGIPAAKKHAGTLVKTGLWIDNGTTWAIRNWDKWNTTKEERDEISRQRSISGNNGAHSRWHSRKKPNIDCTRCQDAGWLVKDE